MKVFVYSKATSKTVAVVTNVIAVNTLPDNKIMFTTESGEHFGFNTKEVKTTSYQN